MSKKLKGTRLKDKAWREKQKLVTKKLVDALREYMEFHSS